MYTRVVSALLFALSPGLFAATADRDFSGKWVLDSPPAAWRTLPTPPSPHLTIHQEGEALQCTEDSVNFAFRLDGTESKYRIGDFAMSTETKWEGAALMVNTLVSGTQNYVLMDRWELSKDHSVLTITRTVQRSGKETEATLIYRDAERAAMPQAVPTVRPAPPPAAPTEYVVQTGTKIPLALVNTISTKHSAEGDRVYLETVFPITQNGRIIIPRGSYVAGTVTEIKRAGHMKGKAELFLRFDSLTLPNGVTRDFRSRLDSSDTGNVDRKEGKITGDSNKAGNARTVAEAAGAGAGIGGLAGGISGHPGLGVGVGALGGAAAGLAGVLLSRGPDLILAKGTTVEMVLDRPLTFDLKEVPRTW